MASGRWLVAVFMFLSVLVLKTHAWTFTSSFTGYTHNTNLVSQFGYYEDGAFRASVGQYKIDGKVLNATASDIGLVLVRNTGSSNDAHMMSFPVHLCLRTFIQDRKDIEAFFFPFKLPSQWTEKEKSGGLESSLNINKDGLYTLYYYSCIPDTAVSFSLTVTHTNPGPSHLSSTQKLLPSVNFIAFIITAAIFVVWCYILFQRRRNSTKIHLVTGLFLFLQLVTMTFNWLRFAAGNNNIGLTITYLIFAVPTSLLLFVLLGLFGVGWSLIKPHLSASERKLIAALVPLQLISCLALICVSVTRDATKAHRVWQRVHMVLNLGSYWVVYQGINMSILSLKTAGSRGAKDRNRYRVRLFSRFGKMLLLYASVMCLLWPFLQTFMPAIMQGVAVGMEYLTALGFFIWIGYYFSPSKGSEYMPVNFTGDEAFGGLEIDNLDMDHVEIDLQMENEPVMFDEEIRSQTGDSDTWSD